MSRVLEKFEQGSQEWLDQRIGMMTGTRSGKINSNRPTEVMREMMREYIGAPSEFVPNEHTERGTTYEPVARLEYLDQTGYTLEDNSEFFQLHDKYDWVGVSPDGITLDQEGNRVGLEIKCPMRFTLKEDGNNNLSKSKPNYFGQVQHFMEVCDLDSCDYVEWVQGDIRILRVQRDKEFWESHLPKLKSFMEEYNSIIKDPILRAEYGDDKNLTVEDDRFERLVEISETKKELDQEFKLLKEELSREKLETSAYNGLVNPQGYRLNIVKKPGSVNYKKIFETYEFQIMSLLSSDKVKLDTFKNKASESITFSPPRK